MARMLLASATVAAAIAQAPPFSSFNCTELPASAFEPVTLSNSVRTSNSAPLGSRCRAPPPLSAR